MNTLVILKCCDAVIPGNHECPVSSILFLLNYNGSRCIFMTLSESPPFGNDNAPFLINTEHNLCFFCNSNYTKNIANNDDRYV